MFTAIHRSLGLPPGALTWEMIHQLTIQQIEETADLDFKKILPIGKGSWRDETAKDLASMANSGGGVLLYGVAEERGLGTAKSIESFEFKESELRALTQVAYNQVHPPLMDLQSVKIADPSRSGFGVLALVISASADVPHMFWKNESFLAPVRHGSDTRWMNERQIELAYRSRFDNLQRRKVDLSNFYDETVAHIGPTLRTCLTAVAVPLLAGRSGTYPSSVEDAEDLYLAARQQVKEFIRSDPSVFDKFSVSPTIGLRRWRWLDKAVDGAGNCLLEVHRDGSIAMVFDIDKSLLDATRGVRINAPDSWNPRVESITIEYAMAVLASFLSAVAELMGLSGAFEVRAGVTWETDSVGGPPLEVFESYGRLQHASRPIRVRRFGPVEASLRAGTANELRADIHLLCTDILNQVGVKSVVYIRDEHPPNPGR
jgi:hypothetical protein